MTRGDKRKKILCVAARMFSQRRFHEVTLDEIAAAAHVGKGTIYLYFKNKDDLLFQMVTDMLSEMERRLTLVAESDKPVRDKLCAFIEEMGEVFRQHHVTLHQFHNPEIERTKPRSGEFLRAHHDRITDLVRKILRQGRDQRLIAPSTDLEAATCIFVSIIHGHDMWFIHSGKDISIEILVELFLNGVKKNTNTLSFVATKI
jgi:AcrR family transcriptional regulator